VQEQQVIGLDIGGATLKAYAAGRVLARRFPLWRQPELLANALRDLLAPISIAASSRIAVTMTGELCDCFPTKADGVCAILDAVRAAFPSVEVRVWQSGGRFVTIDEAVDRALDTAAANFMALAKLVARRFPTQRLLLVDIGSTTTDLTPICGGWTAPKGRIDRARLASGGLVYQGVERTPVCALTQELVLRGVRHCVMNELFATTLDAYLITGDLPEDPDETMTADGRPATRRHAENRLARMVGADGANFSTEDAGEAARQVAAAQEEVLRQAFTRTTEWPGAPFDLVVLAGQGEWLARRVLGTVPSFANVEIASLTERLGTEVSRCACAYAVAELAAACFHSERR